jgi:cytochrome c553
MLERVVSVIFGAVICALIAVPAYAQDDIETKAQVCSACHGQNGEPINATTPIIWGQQANYLYKELHDYHSGARVNPVMAAIVKDLSLQDLRKMADYFAAKPWPPSHAASADAAPPEGIAMCRACHQQNFEGGAPAPRLAGFSDEYLVGAMRSFADGERTNNGDMPGFMKVLTDSQRAAMAHYLAGL